MGKELLASLVKGSQQKAANELASCLGVRLQAGKVIDDSDHAPVRLA